MHNNGLLNSINVGLEWIRRFAYVNILWLLFTLCGLVVLGLMPSTVALLHVTKQWISGHHEIPVFKTFFKTFKKESLKSNLLGILIFVLVYSIYFYYNLSGNLDGTFGQLNNIVFLTVMLIVFFALAFYLPIYVYYELKIKDLITNTFLVSVKYPVSALLIMTVWVIIFILSILIPLFILFFSASILCYLQMYIATRVFNKIEEKLPSSKLN